MLHSEIYNYELETSPEGITRKMINFLKVNLIINLYLKGPKLYQNRYQQISLINHSSESDIYLVCDVLSKKKLNFLYFLD